MICARIVHGQNGNDDLDSTELDDGKLIFAQTVSVEVVFDLLYH